MGLARGMGGTEYFVPSIVGSQGSKTRLVKMVPAMQKISVTKSIRKGQYWRNMFNWREDVFSEEVLNLRFKVDEVKKVGSDEKHVVFLVEEGDLRTKDKKFKENQSVAEVLKELDLTDEKLLPMLRNMLHHVFTKELLEQLLQAKDMEFILDDVWMYLRADEKAWRV